MEISELVQAKTVERLAAIDKLQKQLDSKIFPDDPSAFVDALLSNIGNSNFRIVQLSLSIVDQLV